ncbi:MAG: transcriptional regulator [Alphaproteobacteria bacterium]|nr:MAG: transcriptional regulator [Alphaproteobacteria bacterium]
MEALLRLVSGPWTLHIIWVLSEGGPQRFGELRRAVPGISTRMLTERLRMLEGAGIVWREQAQTIPPAVTYGLTERGEELRGVLGKLGEIARRWQAEGAFSETASPTPGRGRAPGDSG